MIIKYFGVIAEHVGLDTESLEKNDSTQYLETLKQFLEKKYTGLEKLSYQITQNRKIVTDAELNEEDEIALLPPFSGG